MDIDKLMNAINLIGYSVILSGLRYYIEVDFLARFLRVKAKPRVIILYISVCCIFSFLLLSIQMPLWMQSCVHFTILFLAGVVLLKKAIIIALAPCIIATTLFALMDGLSVSISRVLLLVVPRQIIWGTLVPFSLSAILLTAQYFMLKYISNKYQKFNKEYAVSYLYLLLLPCLLTIIMIHLSWGLWDMVVTIDLNDLNTEYSQTFRNTSLLFLAFLSFATVLIAFYKLTEAAESEAEKLNLEQLIKVQRQYVAEAI